MLVFCLAFSRFSFEVEAPRISFYRGLCFVLGALYIEKFNLIFNNCLHSTVRYGIQVSLRHGTLVLVYALDSSTRLASFFVVVSEGSSKKFLRLYSA